MTGISDSPALPVAGVTYQQHYLIKTGNPLLSLGPGYMPLLFLLPIARSHVHAAAHTCADTHTYTHTHADVHAQLRGTVVEGFGGWGSEGRRILYLAC